VKKWGKPNSKPKIMADPEKPKKSRFDKTLQKKTNVRFNLKLKAMNILEDLIILNKKEMVQLNGGGSAWKALGKGCKNFFNAFMSMAEASSESYHMGMM
jgi:hypothetical protein